AAGNLPAHTAALPVGDDVQAARIAQYILVFGLVDEHKDLILLGLARIGNRPGFNCQICRAHSATHVRGVRTGTGLRPTLMTHPTRATRSAPCKKRGLDAGIVTKPTDYAKSPDGTRYACGGRIAGWVRQQGVFAKLA